MAQTKTRWWSYHWHRLKQKKKLAKQLRLRDGDNCWLCGHPMRFGGVPNMGKVATVEHLQPLSKGGSWDIANLALCHLGCNRHMKNFDRAHKEKMRNSRKM